MRRILQTFLLVMTLLAVGATSSHAIPGLGFDLGVRTGYYYGDTDSWFAGADAKFHVLRVNLNPNIEWAFENGDVVTLNVDAFFNLSAIPLLASMYTGIGVGALYSNPESIDSEWNSTFQLLAGLEVPNIPLGPYLQFKYVFTDRHDGPALAAGLRF